jgi:hypothetical protein
VKPLVLVLLVAGIVRADPVLKAGPINLTGTGSVFYNAGEVSWEVVIHASGTNGTDTASINGGAFAQCCGGAQQTMFSAGISQCLLGSVFPIDECSITIDGIGGFGTFTNIGGGVGLLQVFGFVRDPVLHTQNPDPSNLLAEATVFSSTVVTGFTDPAGNPFSPSSSETFDLIAAAPEPSTGVLGLISLSVLFAGRALILRP